YTLYKSQLEENLRENRYTYKTSLKRAFSGSNNPVFGRLGIYELGRELVEDYADRFMFNHPIPFELPVEKSHIDVPDNDFGLAEISSGFNKSTLISPIHASLITSAVVNNGMMMEPWVVSEIRDEFGQVIYSGKSAEFGRPLKKVTAEKIKILMQDTVKYGTCSSTFRHLRSKNAFKNIALGAKTGTINDVHDKYKYDWLTAFAIPKGKDDDGIIITVLAVHGKLLGIRAKDLAKNIINHRFTS
ncbi:penicillin-binding transpeptidase domain-containing protein, partial [Thermodesulfobacteriota bacterium]